MRGTAGFAVPLLALALFSFLESGAGGIRAAASAAGTYRDLLGGAIGVTGVIHAVFYVAMDSRDMLGLVHIGGTSAFFFFTVHN